MNGSRSVLGVISIALLAGCSATPIEYKSNESIEGPGLFESALPFSINARPSEPDDQSEYASGAPDGKVNLGSGTGVIGQCQQLVREFEAFNKFKNLSKGSEEYEEFYQWLIWRDQGSAATGQ